jgi:hypothetical protein
MYPLGKVLCVLVLCIVPWVLFHISLHSIVGSHFSKPPPPAHRVARSVPASAPHNSRLSYLHTHSYPAPYCRRGLARRPPTTTTTPGVCLSSHLYYRAPPYLIPHTFPPLSPNTFGSLHYLHFTIPGQSSPEQSFDITTPLFFSQNLPSYERSPGYE